MVNVLYNEKKSIVITVPWIQIHGYKNTNLLKQVKRILFKGFEGEYPMN